MPADGFREIYVTREEDSELDDSMKEPRRVGLKDGESVTVGQIRKRFGDELQISHDMIALVNNIQKDDNSVPPDGAVVLFKVASRKKG